MSQSPAESITIDLIAGRSAACDRRPPPVRTFLAVRHRRADQGGLLAGIRVAIDHVTVSLTSQG
ncbi:MAG: hypothetical protein QM747_17110 [Nocardioides sp.]